MHIRACLAAMLTISSVAVLLPENHAASLIGNMGVAFCMMLNASPLVAIKTVIQEKSAESIPLSFTVASMCCCFFWSIVGLEEMHDWIVYCILSEPCWIMFWIYSACTETHVQ